MENIIELDLKELVTFQSEESVIPTDLFEKNELLDYVNRKDCSTLEYYLLEISQYRLLSAEEELSLIKRAQCGNVRAKDVFIKSNLRLSVWIAKEFYKRIRKNSTVEFLDLVQQGNMALYRSLESFDCSLGFRFSTYAKFWIRNYLGRFLDNNSKTIRIPAGLRQELGKFICFVDELSYKMNRIPTNQEIAEQGEWNLERVNFLKKVASARLVSMDQRIRREDGNSPLLSEFMSIKTHDSSDKGVDSNTLREVIPQKLKEILSPKEIEVLSLYFGLNGEFSRTFEEIAEEYGVSRQRVHQIQSKALKKLKTIPSLKVFAKELFGLAA